jgi:hypothetical protein
MSANAGTRENVRGARCAQGCAFDGVTIEHHDQLLTVDQNLDQAMALMELAVTWGELDYSEAPLIPPSRWSDFVACHRWQVQDRAQRVFSLAVDAATHSVNASHDLIARGGPTVRVRRRSLAS